MKKVLIIAGFDPSSGAGISLDLKVIRALDEYGVGVITALTVQNTIGVYDIKCTDPDFFEYQLSKLLDDVRPHAMKVGLLGDIDIAKVVLKSIKEYSIKNVVCDPILKSTSGFGFVDDDFANFLKAEFFKACDFITPNKEEAKAIFGFEIDEFSDVSLQKIKIEMKKMGIKGCILKGGHMDKEVAEDILIAEDGFFKVCSKRFGATDDIHGTGCAFSSAFATFLAKGYNMNEALIKTKDLMIDLINNAIKVGAGKLILNP